MREHEYYHHKLSCRSILLSKLFTCSWLTRLKTRLFSSSSPAGLSLSQGSPPASYHGWRSTCVFLFSLSWPASLSWSQGSSPACYHDWRSTCVFWFSLSWPAGLSVSQGSPPAGYQGWRSTCVFWFSLSWPAGLSVSQGRLSTSWLTELNVYSDSH